MTRRSFLKFTGAGAFYECTGNAEAASQTRLTRHLIFLMNGGGARKKDYYEDATLAPNVRRIAEDSFVFEEDHCENVSSHDQAFAELFNGIRYRYVESLRFIPAVMQEFKPRILVCRELAHDVGHDGYEKYLHSIQVTDERIGAIFDWVRRDAYFGDKTAIVIRPEFGRDDDVNPYGELHHSYGYYYTHRVASIFWGPDFRKGVDKKTVISTQDMAPTLAALFNDALFDANTSYVRGRVAPGLLRRRSSRRRGRLDQVPRL